MYMVSDIPGLCWAVDMNFGGLKEVSYNFHVDTETQPGI